MALATVVAVNAPDVWWLLSGSPANQHGRNAKSREGERSDSVKHLHRRLKMKKLKEEHLLQLVQGLNLFHF